MYRSRELVEMHSLLLEKGLRVKEELDLGDYASDTEVVAVDGGRDEEGGDEEIFEIFEERKRLMPY